MDQNLVVLIDGKKVKERARGREAERERKKKKETKKERKERKKDTEIQALMEQGYFISRNLGLYIFSNMITQLLHRMKSIVTIWIV